jgi:ABC-2 type transport system ATP-binding protein
MDEAERCHRLAILDHGRLVADGSPRELMGSLPGEVLIVESDDLRGARRLLDQFPGIIASAQIGAHLRVLVRDGANVRERVTAHLRDGGVQARVEAAPPNLEDVFVSATLGRNQAAEKAA